MPMILAGDLRNRVMLQQPVAGRGASGSTTTTYTDWFECWAAIEALSARELWGASEVQALANTRIRIRYRPGITSDMRVKVKRAFGSPEVFDYYVIAGPPIDVEGRHHELHLMCQLREAEGFRTGPPS
jgi:SPP1 family predicted phage head-tail adaptor